MLIYDQFPSEERATKTQVLKAVRQTAKLTVHIDVTKQKPITKEPGLPQAFHECGKLRASKMNKTREKQVGVTLMPHLHQAC